VTILLDTSVLVARERAGIDLAAGVGLGEPLAISVITLTEYWKGVERADTVRRRKERTDRLRAAVEAIDIVDLDRADALAAARAWAGLERSGSVIGAFDLLIAGTALARGWSLATLDRRDFGRVAGLQVLEL